jgi:hypothetical protein
MTRNRDNSLFRPVMIRLREGVLRRRGSIPGREDNCFSSTNRLDRLCGTPRLIFSGDWRLLPEDKSAGA